MDKKVLLAELRAQLDNAPDFAVYTSASRPHLEWLGKTDALLQRWSPYDAIPFRVAANLMASEFMRAAQIPTLFLVLHRAIADLALDAPKGEEVFGPGATYDFLKALRDVMSSATRSLLVIDPYMDHSVFDAYLGTVAPNVHIRLLLHKYAEPLKASISAYVAQHKAQIEVRSSPRLHDRVVFVDDRSCWVLGQSIKDAAKAKPTYLAPLSSDAVAGKLAFYEDLWCTGAPL